jgi:hypothetical protein
VPNGLLIAECGIERIFKDTDVEPGWTEENHYNMIDYLMVTTGCLIRKVKEHDKVSIKRVEQRTS